eukprot:scaffold9546_cov59-Cylindrotheca_fusiformis.AAC.1
MFIHCIVSPFAVCTVEAAVSWQQSVVIRSTGAVMTWGDGAVQTISRRQKLNTRSSTEAELVGVDD